MGRYSVVWSIAAQQVGMAWNGKAFKEILKPARLILLLNWGILMPRLEIRSFQWFLPDRRGCHF